MIRASEWLAARVPRPPVDISARLESMVGDAGVPSVTELAELFVAEAASLLVKLNDDRTGATDLLVADALITYAMEAAAEDHETFDAVAERAMSMIGASASRGGQR